MTATHAEALRVKGTGVSDLKRIPFGEKKKKKKDGFAGQAEYGGIQDNVN